MGLNIIQELSTLLMYYIMLALDQHGWMLIF